MSFDIHLCLVFYEIEAADQVRGNFTRYCTKKQRELMDKERGVLERCEQQVVEYENSSLGRLEDLRNEVEGYQSQVTSIQGQLKQVDLKTNEKRLLIL